jgi:hypothetical protein
MTTEHDWWRFRVPSAMLLLSIVFLMGCKKEDVYSDVVFGTWAVDEITCIGNYRDSLIPATAQFQFMPSEEIGKSGYGAFMKAEGKLPEWKEEGIVLEAETLYFSAPIEKRTYNYRPSFHGVYARKVIGSTYETLSVDMYKYASDGLYMFIGNRNFLTSHRFSLFRLRLKKVAS